MRKHNERMWLFFSFDHIGNQGCRNILTWVCIYLNIYKLVLKAELSQATRTPQCMGRRGARGLTGAFDGLTLTI